MKKKRRRRKTALELVLCAVLAVVARAVVLDEAYEYCVIGAGPAGLQMVTAQRHISI